MACAACEQRRQIMVTAARTGGAVGLVKSLPTVGQHLLNDIRDRTVRKRPNGKRK